MAGKKIVPTIRGRNVSLVAAMNAHGIIHTNVIDDRICNVSRFLKNFGFFEFHIKNISCLK